LSNRWLAAIYLLAVVALSSATATFEWASPVETPEGSWDWYREIGVRNGVLVAAGHVAPGGGWRFGLRWPRLVPIPLFAGAGPESGGLYAAPWFVLGALAAVHLVVRVRRRAPPAGTAKLPGRQA
jgi:hypothetical protein